MLLEASINILTNFLEIFKDLTFENGKSKFAMILIFELFFFAIGKILQIMFDKKEKIPELSLEPLTTLENKN
jgi:hypothetical protein